MKKFFTKDNFYRTGMVGILSGIVIFVKYDLTAALIAIPLASAIVFYTDGFLALMRWRLKKTFMMCVCTILIALVCLGLMDAKANIVGGVAGGMLLGYFFVLIAFCSELKAKMKEADDCDEDF